MAVYDVNVPGPLTICVDVIAGAVTEAVTVLGHALDGVRLRFTHPFDDVRADDLGGQTIQERIPIGTRIDYEFELHKVDRDQLEDFMWLFAPATDIGQPLRIGRKITDIGTTLGDGDTIGMSFVSGIGAEDWRFMCVAPRRFVQRVGGMHTSVRCTGSFVRVGTPAIFFDQTEVGVLSDSSAVECVGAHLVNIDGNDVGYTREGVEIATEILYNEARQDSYGRETDADLIVDGFGCALRAEIHSGTLSEIKNIAAALAGAAEYGDINSVGVPQSGNLVPLILDSDRAANGKDWTFDAVTVEPDPIEETLGNRNRITSVGFRALPLGAANRYYAIAAGT